MNFLDCLFEVLNARMETPQPFGWFHLVVIGVIVAATVLLVCLCRDRIKKGKDVAGFVNIVVFVTAVLVVLFEIYKQIVFNVSVSEGKLSYDYQWYIFPWQFCSIPMYVGLLAGIFRKGKIHDSLLAFLSTYAVFAGVCVLIYPTDAFIEKIGINIQTMFCHGSMIVIGVFLLCSGCVKLKHSTILKALPVFAAAVLVAIGLNEWAYRSGLLERETLNLFFISPYCEPSLPVYSSVQAVVPYPWCLLIYLFAFTLASYIILLVAMGIGKLCSLRARRSEK